MRGSVKSNTYRGLCKVTVLFLQKLCVFTTQEIAAYLIIEVKNVTTDIVEV